MPESLRPITVDGQRFRWRFDERIVVIPADRSGPQLRVEWGWRGWMEPEGAGAEPHIVTPRFVADAIRFALAQGWQPVTNGPPLLLVYKEGGFRAASDHT